MNRAERRKLGITSKEPTYMVSQSQIQQMKKNITNEVVDTAFILMLGLPVMVLHDKYALIMKKEGREERFTDLVLDLYDSFEKGYLTLDDVKVTLKEECGINFEEKRKDRRIL